MDMINFYSGYFVLIWKLGEMRPKLYLGP